MSLFRSALLPCCIVALGACSAPQPEAPPETSADDLVGRWDLTIATADGTYPSWLELTRDGEVFSGRFVGRSGHARPVTDITVEGPTVEFTLPTQYEEMDSDLSFTGELTDDRLSGQTNANAPAGTQLSWSAVRAPALPAPESVEWGEARDLFNGKDLTGWRLMDPEQDQFWKVEDGILVNDVKDEGDVGEGTGLITEDTFQDFKLHVEFRYPKGSNSGIYLRGRYEVQIQDDFGKAPGNRYIAGVYGFLTPTENTAKEAGEWQTLDMTLLGRYVTVGLNDAVVIDNQEIPGITGGALDSREDEPGPIFIQGDHGPIEFRKIVITPVI